MTGSKMLKVARDAGLIIGGSTLFALGLDCFLVPSGLAAGGITGLATIVNALWHLPVGMQVILVNALLIGLIVRSGNRHYLIRTVAGIICSGVLTDILAQFVPVLGGDDLLLCALWGGALCGAGLGLVFRTGGNTGGVDVIAQFLSRRTGLTVGTLTIILDFAVILASVPVFSLRNALYAVVAVMVSGKVCDIVLDGMSSQRAAYIISEHHEQIAHNILFKLNRGCTRLHATGVWSNADRPVLFCVVSRVEAARLKAMVSECDPDAIVIISEVYEAFGEGFRQIDA